MNRRRALEQAFAPSVAADLPMRSPYYRHAATIAIVLIALVAVRLHELHPLLSRSRLVLLAEITAVALILGKSRSEVIRDALRNPLAVIVALYFGWGAITSPFALWPSLALRTAVAQFVPIALLFLVVLASPPTREVGERLKIGFVGAAFVHGAYLLLTAGPSLSDRLGSVGSLDPNDLAILMVIVFPFAVSLTLQRRGWRRLMGLGAAVVCVGVLLKTGSRGGALAFAAACAAYVLVMPGKRRALALLALSLALGASWRFAPPVFRERMVLLFSGVEDYNYTDYSGRKQIWARARSYIADRPVMGAGMNNFPMAEGEQLARVGRPGRWATTHNTYLQVASELGLVGLAIYVVMLLLVARYALTLSRPTPELRRWRGSEPEFAAAASGFLIGAIFLSHAYFYAFFALVALTAGAYRSRVTRCAPFPSGPVIQPHGVSERGGRRRNPVAGFRTWRGGSAHPS